MDLKKIFFEVENDHGKMTSVPAAFFKVPRGSWIIVPNSRRRRKKTLKNVKKGDRVLYVGKQDPNDQINKAFAVTKGMTLLKDRAGRYKYYIVNQVIDLSGEEDHHDSLVEGVLMRGW
jgi:hypothetical protein